MLVSFIAVQLKASARQRSTVFRLCTLGVVQLVGVHIDFAFGSVAPVFAVGSGVIRVLEPYAVFVFGRATSSIDIGFVVQVCSIGDRNSSALIQIKPFGTGLDIINAQFEELRTVRCTCIVSSIDHL